MEANLFAYLSLFEESMKSVKFDVINKRKNINDKNDKYVRHQLMSVISNCVWEQVGNNIWFEMYQYVMKDLQ